MRDFLLGVAVTLLALIAYHQYVEYQQAQEPVATATVWTIEV